MLLPPIDAPRELEKVSLPEYIIEPPDVLLIDAFSVVPLTSYQISPLDVLQVQASPSFPEKPITGFVVVSGSGVVDLGPDYGSVAVAGLTELEAREAVQRHLAQLLKDPTVSLSIAQTAASQQIAGEHLVAPDGTVTLGTYGRVHVTGQSVDQARQSIEYHLSHQLRSTRVSVSVVGYNSKRYYVITEGGGLGDAVRRFPVTGNETVLDAVANIDGLSQVSSKKMWIARPAPACMGPDQILPVDWVAITKGGATATNYQILPGDRVFIAEDHMVKMDNELGKTYAPFERTLGFTLLGIETVQAALSFPTGIFTNR